MDSLLRGLLNPNPDERLGSKGIEEVKNHPFFQGVNWANPRERKSPFIPEKKFNLNKLKGIPSTDMLSMVTERYKLTKDGPIMQPESGFNNLGLHFDFLRFDLLHTMNVEALKNLE